MEHEINEAVTAYQVSMLPLDDIDADVWGFRVEYAGHGLWAVRNLACCIGADGVRSYESRPSSRTDEWLAAHRFPLEDALALARRHLPGLVINGMTAEEVLARKAEWAAEDAVDA